MKFGRGSGTFFLLLTVFLLISCAAPATQAPAAQMAPAAQAPAAAPAAVQAINAGMWIQVDKDPKCVLEGPAFDRDGNLYFCDVNGKGRVYRANVATREFKLIYEDGKSNFASVKIHKDGSLYLCGVYDFKLVIIKPDGTMLKELSPEYDGNKLSPDELCFRDDGSFYFTSYDGIAKGSGVYLMSAGLDKIELIAGKLDHPNGVSLSPDGRQLWVPETLKQVEHHFELGADGKVVRDNPFHIPSTDPGYPDSNYVDSAGNCYQALWNGARLVVFNGEGKTVARVVLPEDDEEAFNQTTNATMAPGTDTGYLTTSGPGGGRIYKFKGLAKALTLYSHK